MTAPARARLAILTPVYDEEENLDAYVREVTQVLFARPDLDVSVLFIDDGSSDGSWRKIAAAAAADPRFRGIRLSRNFGSHAALCAGFASVEGDAVATLACDLQDPPSVILEFVERWRAGARIVWGSRRTREDVAWRIGASRLFQSLLRRHAMPPGSLFTTGSFLLVDRRVLECLREFRETHRITFALVAWTGFEQAVVEYDRRRRTAGTSGWTFRRMMKTMYDAFLGFSTLPIAVMTGAAVLALLFTVVLSIYLVVHWFRGVGVPGWTSQMLGLSVFFGVQFSLMAIAGQYLYRIYAEVVRRPLYFVSDATPGADRPAKSD